MLKTFSRLEKTRNFILLAFAIIMVASLIFFYAPTQGDISSTLTTSSETAAKVASEYITVGEVARQKESYARFMQGRPYPAKLVVDGMIGSRIARVEAARLGLTASDAEVAAEIRQQFKPQDGKPFDQKQYEQSVVSQFGSIKAFEESVRDDLSANKLRAFITSGVTVSEEEVLKDYQRRNTKFDLSYVMISPDSLAQTITPTDAELEDYFNRNKQAYYIGVPQKKIRYIFLNTAKRGEKLEISDADLQAEYDKLPEDKRIAGVNGQEIVLRVAKPEFDGQVFEKANNLVERLKAGGTTVTEEAFAELAKGQSENAATAGNGGKLPGMVRENLNKPDDPYQRLIKMKPGEITEPISYQGRYFILRRGETVPKTLETAKKELEISLRNRRAYGATAELAKKVAAALKENKNVDAVAQQFAAEANMAVSDMIRETAYVKPGDDVEKIGNSPQFEEGIAGLQNPQDVGDEIPVPEGFAVPLLVDKKEPRDAEFAEVKVQPDFVNVVKQDMARARIENLAKQVASGSASATAIAAAATANGVKAAESKGFVLGSPLGEGTGATTSEQLENAIYGLRAGEATKEPIKIGETYYIVGVTNRQEASMEEFAKQRDTLTEQLLNQKRGDVFSEYLASTRRKMEAEGDIRIYDDVLAKIDAADAQNAPAGIPPGIPGM
ncbi:MAG: SurA N-terminal domain-containing protein [Pyrinomonadaceae bacterium]|nr:SurA N-terminal domain-containing protein [Pyrinomonadaceae bacterium]